MRESSLADISSLAGKEVPTIEHEGESHQISL